MRELTIEEINEVAGGPAPIVVGVVARVVVAGAKACAKNNACKGAVFAGAGAAAAAFGYENNRA